MEKLYKNQSLIYKYLLYAVSIFCIVFFFPKGGKFKYEFQKGKPWQYENLYAPFDFSVKKSQDEIAVERQKIIDRQFAYYRYDEDIAKGVIAEYEAKFSESLNSDQIGTRQYANLKKVGQDVLERIYENGILVKSNQNEKGKQIYLIKQNEAKEIQYDGLYKIQDVESVIESALRERQLGRYNTVFQSLFFDLVKPNVAYDENLSQKALEDELSKISLTRGSIDEGKLIIAKGEVVESDNYKILESLKDEFESELWASNNYYFILAGYTVLVALVLMMLFLFLKKYRPEIFENGTKVTFIFINILLMVFITTLVVKYNEAYVFVVPLCILPLILKTFFDARLGLFVHVLTVLILGFVVPNSFEYIFIQIMMIEWPAMKK